LIIEAITNSYSKHLFAEYKKVDMKIKSMKAFRHDFKMSIDGLKHDECDENFMGWKHNKTPGLFAMFHGEKSDVEGLLAMPTEMAEDGQAVYEFIQNAADSDASHFYMFYNDKYLLTINNGSVFDKGGIKSILNIGQSYNKKHDPDKIGRFGIGFKLIHRLVGTSSGLDEIIKDYKGPQLYSWSRKSDFTDFIGAANFIEDGLENELPWLMKILITCFPATVDEQVKDLDYNERIPYKREELVEFQNFVKENIQHIDSNYFNQGTMIFIGLGNGKKELLSKDQDDINSRIENTLYFLKDLHHIQVNDKVIQRQADFILEEKFIVNPDEDDFKQIGITDSRDKLFPVILQFGYNTYSSKNLSVKNYPNFYKFFPMEDTTYKLQFIFHSNVFSIGSNRRHIHEHDINAELLRLLSRRMQNRMNEHILNKSSHFYDIYANILLSECSKQFVSANLMASLLAYISDHTPASDGTFLNRNSIIIKNTLIDCLPSDFGIEKKWFKWNKTDIADSELIKEAQNTVKLGLKSYTLKNLLDEGEINSVNSWIEKLSDSEFDTFITELEDNIPQNISKIKFIKLENGDYKSISEIVDADILFKFPKIESLEGVLRTLNFKLTKTNFENFPTIKAKLSEFIEYLKEDAEVKLYDKKIVPALTASNLTPLEKKTLFLSLKSFKNIAEKTLSDKLLLFCNKDNEKQPLSKLIDPTINGLELWIKEYCINIEEVFNEIKSEEYLRGSKTIFNDIIVPDWDLITVQINSENVLSFYESVVKYYRYAASPLSIKSKQIIYCGENGWKSFAENIFYHSQLSTFARYTDLYELFDEISVSYPVKAVLGVLSNEPFGIQDSDIERLISSGIYSKETVLALLEFCKGKVNIFEYGYFSDESGNIRFETDTDCKQYYSDKTDVIDYIQTYCDNALISLPVGISGFKESVVKGEKLYKEIIDSSEESWKEKDEVLNILLNLLSDSGLKDVSKNFVNSIDCIQLSSADCNDAEITFVWMKLLNSIFETNEFDSIKSKVSIDGISLSELSWNNVISLEGEGEIELGLILEKFADTKAVSAVRDHLLKSNKFDANKINALFQSDIIPSDHELVEIAEEMLIEESNQLKNSHQLRLIIYLFRKRKLISINQIKVLAIDSNWYSLADTWYLRPYDFIDDDAVLDSCYEGIERNRFGEYSIISKPYFLRESNTFICSHLKESLQGDALIHFLELVKEQIIKNAQSIVNWLDDFTDNIGFIPSYSILSDSKYIYAGEELPEVVVVWTKRSNENNKVLEAIGVNGNKSAIVQLRQYLLREIDEYSFEGFSRSSERDKFLLKNSMSVMSEAEIEFDDEFGVIIKSITEFISPVFDISDIRLPASVRIDGIQIFYQLKEVNSAYLISPEFISGCKKFIGNGYTAFIQSLIDDEITIVDPDCLSDGWKNKYTKPLQFNDAEIDIDKLESESQPCDLTQYISWKENTASALTISIIENSIPYYVSLKDFEHKFIKEYREGDIYYDSESQILYTKRETYNEAVIKELKDLIDSDELTDLIGGGAIVVHSARETELLQEIQNLKEKLNAISPGEDMERGGLGKDPQRDWSLEARNMLRNHLNTVDGFDCSGWDDSNIPSSVVRGVKFQGKDCTWIVRSAMSNKSQFHLTPYEWTLLEQKDVFLALRTSQHEIRIYGIDEDIRKVIFENNHTININFDSELLTFEGIDGFAKLLVQFNVWGSGLVFKNPEYSAGNSFKDLEKCKEGIANKLSDDAL